MPVFPSLGCPPGPCNYRESTPGCRSSPRGRASPFWALLPDEILRLLPLIHEEASLQGRRGNLHHRQGILQFRLRSAASLTPWLCVRLGWQRCPISFGLCDKEEFAQTIGWPQGAPGSGAPFSSHLQKSPSSASLSPSEKQLGFGDGSSVQSAPQTPICSLKFVPSRDSSLPQSAGGDGCWGGRTT